MEVDLWRRGEERRGEKGGGPALRNCKHTGWRTRAQSSFGVGLGYPIFYRNNPVGSRYVKTLLFNICKLQIHVA